MGSTFTSTMLNCVIGDSLGLAEGKRLTEGDSLGLAEGKRLSEGDSLGLADGESLG